MRKISISSLLCLLAVFFGCDDLNVRVREGQVQFTYSTYGADNGRRQAGVGSLLITIKDADGTIVHDKKLLNRFSFNNEYISEVLALSPGDYSLEEFFVLDENNDVLYAAPRTGSDLAHLVPLPLPQSFSIADEDTVRVNAQVISVEEGEPAQFGYTTFAFTYIADFDFSVASFVYDNASRNFVFATSSISITAETGDVLYTGDLAAETNHIRLRDGFSNYHVVVTKEGYETYSEIFTQEVMKAFVTSPLTIELLATEPDANRAISFDGVDDYIELGNVYDNVTLPITISAWIYVEPGTTGQIPLFTSQNNPDVYAGFWFVINPSHLFAGYGDGLGSNSVEFRRDKSAPHVEAETFGRWVHVAAVIRGAEDTDIYIDGVDHGGVYTGNSFNPMLSNLPAGTGRIGHWRSNGSTMFFRGMMDELRIWNRALSADEVLFNMSHYVSGSETGLIGYWNFDEADGTQVIDRSGTVSPGSVQGNAVRVVSGMPELQ